MLQQFVVLCYSSIYFFTQVAIKHVKLVIFGNYDVADLIASESDY